MKLSIIIVTYNSEDSIKGCIDSILKYSSKEGEIIIVDNNSSDNTKDIIKQFSQDVKLIPQDKNFGFGKANNIAAKQAKGEYLFFLNPDTQMTSPINELIELYENTPDVGIIGPKLIMPNGQIQESVRNLPTIWGAISEYIFGIPHAYSQYAPKGDKPMEVDSIYGAAMLISRDLFQDLGEFDEKFFLYYEDLDLCRRIKAMGKKVYYYPEVSIKHMVGGSHSTKDKNLLNYQSSIKYHGRLKAFLFQLFFLVLRLRRRLAIN